MLGRRLGALLLVVFLSTANALAPVDPTWLTSIVEGVKGQYDLGDAFSLAVNIPQNQDPDGLQQVLQEDAADKVKQSVSGGDVYQGARVVAATQSEAAPRVLDNIQPLVASSAGNFLLLYSDPLGSTDQAGLAAKIDGALQKWAGYALVASDADTCQRSRSFTQLGLDHVFRCYQPGDGAFQCTSCSSGAEVTPSPGAQTNEESADVDNQPDTDIGPNTGKAAGVGTGAGEEIHEENTEPSSSCKHGKGNCKLRPGGKVAKGKKWGKVRGGKGKKLGKIRGGKGKKWEKVQGGKGKKLEKVQGGRKGRKGEEEEE